MHDLTALEAGGSEAAGALGMTELEAHWLLARACCGLLPAISDATATRRQSILRWGAMRGRVAS